MQAALAGINTAVVGLLLAALYDPLWTSSIAGPVDLLLALAAWAALVFGRLPPWLLMLLCATGGGLGAALLLLTDPAVFEAVVPWLVALGSALLLLRDRWLGRAVP